jgi:hypothetical protein
MSASARRAPEGAAALVEELTASLTRASYQRSSVSAHTGSGEDEMRRIKMYVDAVFSDLLEIH